MRAKILLVEGATGRHADVSCDAFPAHEIVRASTAARGLELLDEDEAFAVVVSERTLDDAQGLEFLAAARERRPDVVAIYVAPPDGSQEAIGALRAGQLFRLLIAPCPPGEVAAAVFEVLARHADEEHRALESEELRFSKDSLAGLTEVLEQRIASQTAALRRLHRFAVELNAATTIPEIVGLAAAATHEVLARRGVHVQVWDDEASGTGVETSAGPEMSPAMHRQALQTKEGAIGEIVVDLGGRNEGRLSQNEIDLLAAIASSTAVAAHHELRRRERDHAQHATILALARLSEQRDNQTGKHLERVAAYCELIAAGLREDGRHRTTIDDVFIDDLVRSSPLHDIGKVGIPDSILLKPGKLSPAEWEIMKTHADLGALTLDSVIQEFGSCGFLAMGRDIARSHHERWDGSGYPRGLSGEAIPLSARILALADVYDALTTVRPYKSAWPHAQAVDWLRAQSGSHFDPAIVESFLARNERADDIRARLADRLEDYAPPNPELVVRPT